MLTEKGRQLQDILVQRKQKAAEAAKRAAQARAVEWATDRVIRLDGQCETTPFNTNIDLVELSGSAPTEEEQMRIDELGRQLGVRFTQSMIAKHAYAGNGGPPFSISMSLDALLSLLAGNLTAPP